MNIKCQKCGYEWNTKSKHNFISCPSCLTKVPRNKMHRFELGKCQKCGKHFTSLDIHHIVPLSEGGTNDTNNLIQLCKSCHVKEHNELRVKK